MCKGLLLVSFTTSVLVLSPQNAGLILGYHFYELAFIVFFFLELTIIFLVHRSACRRPHDIHTQTDQGKLEKQDKQIGAWCPA